MSNETEKQIDAVLAYAGIDYKATLMMRGEVTDGWEHDVRRVRFTRGDDDFMLEFRTGTGQRLPAPRPYDGGPPPRRGTVMHEQLEAERKPVAPRAASVLHCVVSDDPRGEPFEWWAEGLGYDTDSRNALNIYLQCQQQTADARRFFGAQFDAIAEALEDY